MSNGEGATTLRDEIDALDAYVDEMRANWLDSNVYEPSHYRSGEVETIDKIDAILSKMTVSPFHAYCIGNVVKYVDRAGKKAVCGDYEKGFELDMAKAAQYLNRLIFGEW